MPPSAFWPLNFCGSVGSRSAEFDQLRKSGGAPEAGAEEQFRLHAFALGKERISGGFGDVDSQVKRHPAPNHVSPIRFITENQHPLKAFALRFVSGSSNAWIIYADFCFSLPASSLAR
jgi:hypothetical protein